MRVLILLILHTSRIQVRPSNNFHSGRPKLLGGGGGVYVKDQSTGCHNQRQLQQGFRATKIPDLPSKVHKAAPWSSSTHL